MRLVHTGEKYIKENWWIFSIFEFNDRLKDSIFPPQIRPKKDPRREGFPAGVPAQGLLGISPLTYSNVHWDVTGLIPLSFLKPVLSVNPKQRNIKLRKWKVEKKA